MSCLFELDKLRLIQHSTYWVIRIRHSVEWTKSHGELVDDIIISVVLSFDYAAKSLLVLGT